MSRRLIFGLALLATLQCGDAARAESADAKLMEQLAREFPEGTFLRQTNHYLLVYDGQHPWADTRVRLLEICYANYFRQMRQGGLRPSAPESRLPIVLFNEHGDFAQYAKRTDGMARVWAAGYYSTRTNRVAMFNFHTSPQMEEMLLEMRQAEADVERWRGAAAGNASQRPRLIRAERKLAVARRRYQTASAWGNIQQTMHEATHQLAFNTGIQRRDLQYPMWFSEGLATGFETITPAAPFGPAHDNPGRRAALLEARRKGQIKPLAEFIKIESVPDNDLPRHAAYAQSWALFQMLLKKHPDQLRAYIDRMNKARRGGRTADQHVEDFVACFGPIENVEREWRAYLSRLTR